MSKLAPRLDAYKQKGTGGTWYVTLTIMGFLGEALVAGAQNCTADPCLSRHRGRTVVPYCLSLGMAASAARSLGTHRTPSGRAYETLTHNLLPPVEL